jgi:hypothetical protein
MARSGARWRDLPEQFGGYETVKRRYYRWIEMDVLDEILAALAREADLEWLMIDSTIVRAHQHAAGASRQKGGVDSDAKCNPVDSIGSSTKSRVPHSERRPSARFPGDKDGSARRNVEPLQ